MLDSGTKHSFVHPRVAKSMGVEPSQVAALTVTVTNGNQVLCCNILELDLRFLAEGRDHQVVAHSCLHVLERL